MNTALVEGIADAVLYEGYLLYPYRPSAVKNRQRWNFGVLYPKSYSESADSGDAWVMETECLVQGSSTAQVQVKVRCLQLVSRSIGELVKPLEDLPSSGLYEFHAVDSLTVGDQVFKAWQEAVAREISPPVLQVDNLARSLVRHAFQFHAERTFEPLRDEASRIVGVVVREKQLVSGVVEVSAERLGEDIFKIGVVTRNITALDAADPISREDASMRSMLSTHTILGVENGQFVSLFDPPDSLSLFAARCQNSNAWPVLVGDDGSRDLMLSSPIILYDYPQIAPESPGDLFDGTEIDEILALRIMTMTDDEKREVRQSDPRGRELLERTETLPPEHLMKLHGALRSLRSSPEKAS
jgi:hydrogenase maturation protease